MNASPWRLTWMAVLTVVALTAEACDGPGAERPTAVDRGAVIVDQLSLSAPNPAFATDATKILEGAGFTVDYVPGEAVTVERYSTLPAGGYDLIVLRAHSARVMGEDEVLSDDVALFTGELIDLTAYDVLDLVPGAATAVAEEIERLGQARDGTEAEGRFSADELAELIPVTYSVNQRELPFFGLRPGFVSEHFDGRFENAPTVVLMGCDGLRNETMASAFLDRGAARFVSWDEPVLAGHTDAATLELLEHLIVGNETMEQAVANTMAAVGPDPESGAVLVSLP